MALGGVIKTWIDGAWHDGNTPIIGAADHAAWLGSTVFDGARQFEGVRPDLMLNCHRIIASAQAMGLLAPVTAQQVFALCEEGCKFFPADAALYIRPMMWAKDGTAGIINVDPNSAGFCVCIEELPMPEVGDFSLTVSSFRRPHQDTALNTAKAGSLYVNNGRILAQARAQGFNNALSLDLEGHVAETASTNVFAVRDGVVFTPVPNGTFLNGLNRQRVIKLLRADGLEVTECPMTVEDFATADEIFCTGNIAKIMPVNRFEDRILSEHPVTSRTRQLYWDFAHSSNSAMG